MKKRLLSTLLALCMVLGMLPANANATSDVANGDRRDSRSLMTTKVVHDPRSHDYIVLVMDSQGQVKQSFYYRWYTGWDFDKDGIIGVDWSVTDYSYDINGHIIKAVENSNGEIENYTYKYDLSQDRIYRYLDDTLDAEYDTEGRIFISDGGYYEYSYYPIEDDGFEISQYHIDEQGYTTASYRHSYDNKGNLISWTASLFASTYYPYTYDDDGRILKEKTSNLDHSIFDFNYDESGKVSGINITGDRNSASVRFLYGEESLTQIIVDGKIIYSASGSSGLDTATITKLYPANGSTFDHAATTGDAAFHITFDREIPNAYGGRPGLDFSVGTLEVHRTSDDKLIYSVTESPFTAGISSHVSLYGSSAPFTAISIDNITSELDYDTEYYVTMPAGFIKLADGATSPAIAKGEWEFSTAKKYEIIKIEDIPFKNGPGEGNEANIDVEWNDAWFDNDATTYIHDLAITSMALSGISYVEINSLPSSTFIVDALEKLNFKHVEAYNYFDAGKNNQHYDKLSRDDNDHVGYTFAIKEIGNNPNKPEFLIAIVVKGTSGNEEWYSNFNIGTNDTHAGFALAKNELMGDLKSYVKKYGLDNTNSKYLVTGHSRGAAVANLVAAELTQSSLGDKSSVYGYTFATPTVSVNATRSGYENIFNIISGEDFVTQVPLGKWNYGHYGIDLLLPSKSYYSYRKYSAVSAKMAATYKDLVNKDYDFYPNGTQNVDSVVASVYQLAPSVQAFYTEKHDISGTLLFKTTTTNEYFQIIAGVIVDGLSLSNIGNGLQILLSSNQSEFAGITWFFIYDYKFNDHIFSAHSMASYYSWLSSCTAKELFGDLNQRTSATFKRIRIACPVNVYVYDESGILVASIVDEAISENTLAVSVENAVKTIDLPGDQIYSIEIVATDEGSVNYTVEEWSAQATGDSILRTVTFNPIGIETGDKLIGEVNDVLYTDSNKYALTNNDGDIIYPNGDSLHPLPGIPGDETDIPSTPSFPSGWGGYHSGSNSSNIPSYQVTVSTAANGTVTVTPKSAKSGDKVTITAKPNDGYAIDSVIVTDSSGKSISITDNGDSTYTFTMPSSKVTVNVTFVQVQVEQPPVEPVETPWVNPFLDVSESDWFYDDVAYVVQNGLMGSMDNGQFNPNGTTTRGMLMTILARLEGIDTSNSNPWYQSGMEWAMRTGVSDGTNPDGSITREQLATMLWRYAGEPAVTGDLSSYPDTGNVHDWASTAMVWAVQNGIINGMDGKLNPQGNAIRAQVAAMLTRFCKNVVK